MDWGYDSLTIEVDEVDGITCVTLRGELDAYTAPRLRQVPLARVPAKVRVDLSMLGFIDHSGVRALFRFEDRVTRAGGHVEIHGASGSVQQVLQMVSGHPSVAGLPSPRVRGAQIRARQASPRRLPGPRR